MPDFMRGVIIGGTMRQAVTREIHLAGGGATALPGEKPLELYARPLRTESLLTPPRESSTR